MAAIILLTAGALAGCAAKTSVNAKSTPSAPPDADANDASREGIKFVDVTADSGIEFIHTDGAFGRHYIVETVSCGLALFDYDGDDLIDIYFCNGAPLSGGAVNPSPRHALYKNLGGMRFRDVSEQAGVACRAFGLGVAVGDYNNDGYADIYLSNFGENVLYRNNGDGTFTDATAAAGLGLGRRVGAGACFLDADADGDLDLLAANYVQFSLSDPAATGGRGRAIYPGPLDFPRETNVLLRNEGNGAWTDISETAGIAAKSGTGMGAICADFDDDGDTDIYIANDEMANFLFQNDGRAQFEEAGVASGAAYDDAGLAHGSMGVDAGDFDNDGRLDLYVTAYQHESTTLYRRTPQGLFQDVTRQTRAGEGAAPHVTWGCCIADFENDGDRDVFVACGHLDTRNENKVYRAPNLVFKNLLSERGEAVFANVSQFCGDLPKVQYSSRGAAADDLDNDGDLDVVVINSRDRPTVLENRSADEGANHWLQLQLDGSRTNRDGVGARVRVTAGELALVDEVHSGRGYQSHWGSRLHFGLGNKRLVDRIEVHWLGGGVDVLENVPVDQRVTITQSER